jgi:hypothetical protein
MIPSDYLNSDQQRIIEAAIRLRLRNGDLPGASLDDATYGPRLATEARRDKALYAICAQFLVDWAAARRCDRAGARKQCRYTPALSRQKHVIRQRRTAKSL